MLEEDSVFVQRKDDVYSFDSWLNNVALSRIG